VTNTRFPNSGKEALPMFKRIFGFLTNITKAARLVTSFFKALIMTIGLFKQVQVAATA